MKKNILLFLIILGILLLFYFLIFSNDFYINKKIDQIKKNEIVVIALKNKTKNFSKMNIYLFNNKTKLNRLLIKNLKRNIELSSWINLSKDRERIIFALYKYKKDNFHKYQTPYLYKVIIYNLKTKRKYELNKHFLIKNKIYEINGTSFSKNNNEIIIFHCLWDVKKYLINYKTKKLLKAETVLKHNYESSYRVAEFTNYSIKIINNNIYIWSSYFPFFYCIKNGKAEKKERYIMGVLDNFTNFNGKLFINFDKYNNTLQILNKNKVIFSKKILLNNVIFRPFLGDFNIENTRYIYNDKNYIYIIDLKDFKVKKLFNYKKDFYWLQIIKWR